MDRVRDFLGERQVRNVIVLADTCHAGKLITRGERGFGSKAIHRKGQERTKHPKRLGIYGWR